MLHFPLINSKVSGFFLCGIILEPVVKLLGNEIKLNSWLMNKHISIENLDKIDANEAIDEDVVFSIFPLDICAAIELYFKFENDNSAVV